MYASPIRGVNSQTTSGRGVIFDARESDRSVGVATEAEASRDAGLARMRRASARCGQCA